MIFSLSLFPKYLKIGQSFNNCLKNAKNGSKWLKNAQIGPQMNNILILNAPFWCWFVIAGTISRFPCVEIFLMTSHLNSHTIINYRLKFGAECSWFFSDLVSKKIEAGKVIMKKAAEKKKPKRRNNLKGKNCKPQRGVC